MVFLFYFYIDLFIFFLISPDNKSGLDLIFWNYGGGDGGILSWWY